MIAIQLQIYIICDRITWIYPSRVGKIVSQTKGKRYSENSSITSIFSYLPHSMIHKDTQRIAHIYYITLANILMEIQKTVNKLKGAFLNNEWLIITEHLAYVDS